MTDLSYIYFDQDLGPNRHNRYCFCGKELQNLSDSIFAYRKSFVKDDRNPLTKLSRLETRYRRKRQHCQHRLSIVRHDNTLIPRAPYWHARLHLLCWTYGALLSIVGSFWNTVRLPLLLGVYVLTVYSLSILAGLAELPFYSCRFST